MSIKCEYASIIDRRIGLLTRALLKISDFVRQDAFFSNDENVVLRSTITLNKGFPYTRLHGYKVYTCPYNWYEN